MWELRLARQDELEKIFARYAAHAAWMSEVGIYQWNDTDYLGCIRRTTMRICSGAGKEFCARRGSLQARAAWRACGLTTRTVTRG